MKRDGKLNLQFGIWVVLFFTTWAFVLSPGELTLGKVVAGCWLIAQAVGFGLQRIGVGVSEGAFWHFFADSQDGGINHTGRRRLAWFCHAVLDHFSLIQWPVGVHARGGARSAANLDRK